MDLEFTLVEGLATELTRGELKLPSLPKTIIRIREALSSQDYGIAELARLVGAEPVLAGNILTMANSVTFRRGAGQETTDIQVAISRIGTGMVHTAATAFTLRQLRDSEDFKAAEKWLAPEWVCASRTAATTYLVAKQAGLVKADEALVLGLIHNIGRIYLYSRAPLYPKLFACEDRLTSLVDSWHAAVGKAIVEMWGLPSIVSEVVAKQNEPEVDEEEHPPLLDVLKIALSIAASEEANPPEALEELAQRPESLRLGLTNDDLAEIDANREDLRQQLGLG